MSKRKGSVAERELVRLFWSVGWASLRAAGSGSSSLPCPDVIAGGDGRLLVVECKSVSGDRIRVSRDQADELVAFASRIGAEPWVGARFPKGATSHGEGWFFVLFEDMKGSDLGFSLSTKEAIYKGVSFEELTKQKV